MGIVRMLRAVKSKMVVHVKDVTRPYVINIVKENRFAGQVAIVTGGSGVIGRSICYRLAAEGAHVFVGGSHEHKVMQVVDEISKAGLKASPLLFDLLDEQSVTKAFADVIQDAGKIDLLVCCAGGGAGDKMSPFVEQEMSVIDNVLDINLRGGILCTKEACKNMIERHRGKIIIISSTVGICGMPSYSEYAAAKAGLMAFVKSIAMELGTKGIRINCVTPGIVQRGTIDDIQLQRIKKTNWVGDYGKPEDIASMVAYLNSDEADFITGQNFVVDGGRSLGLKNS